MSLFNTGQFRQQLSLRQRRHLSLLKGFAPKPVVAPMILQKLRHPRDLFFTLVEVADEMMTLCRMEKRKTRLETAETLRGLAT
jgi:hypothetical protein